MHPQLELLLQIQDLKAQQSELSEGSSERTFQKEEFNLDIDQALDELGARIDEMEGQLGPGIKGRYAQLASGRTRVVVPSINGVCYGCFMHVATSLASDPDRFRQIHHCDNCGRFLYFVD